MTYTSRVILDSNLQGGQLYASTTFVGAKFLLLDTVDLPMTEAYELGMSLNVIVPIIGRTAIKNYPILAETVIGIGDTFYVVVIPDEISNSQYSMQLVIGMSAEVDEVYLRVYAFSSEVTLDTINENIDILSSRIDTILSNQTVDLTIGAANTFNAIQNNIAFGILSASLAPITAGASTAALPPLSLGTSVLSPLLLPGT